MSRLLAAICALSLSGLLLAAGQQTLFRGTTELVPVYATVLDQDGRLIPDLTQDEFEIRDGGALRPITLFSREPQPIAVVVLLDRSGSVLTHSDVVQRGAIAFINKLLPGDRARVGAFGDVIQILPSEFTGNRFDLLSALQGGLQADRNGAASPVWSAVSRSAATLAQEPTRRVVLVFTDGHDVPAYSQARVKFNDLQRQIAEDDVMVYAIGVPGSVPNRSAGQFSTSRVLRAQTFSPPDPDLRKLAEESGGGFIDLDKQKRDLDDVFARIADELHAQYALGFSPVKLDGKEHELEIRVKRPGASVRARKSYVAK
jgi:Ca-activated chloride channel homolog